MPAKDQDAPKRAMSAYHFYAQEKRADVKSATPGITSAEIQKKLTDEWRVLGQDEREKYIEMANEDKKRYERDAVGYVPPPKPTKSGKRLAKDAEAPKKAKTAYLFFADDKRPALSRQHPGLGVGGLAQHLAAAWKVCSEKERKKYETLAEKDKARYKKEMETYTPSEAYLKAKEEFKKKKKVGAAGGDASLELPASLFDSEEMETLREETKKLTKQVADLTKQTSKQASIIEKLTEKLDKKTAKEKELKEKKTGKAPAKPKKTEEEEEEPVAESFDEFTLRVWGKDGSAATPKMKKVLEKEGKDALIQFLADLYAKENDSSAPVSGKKRKAAEPASVPAEAPKKRGRPKGSKNKPKEV